MRKINKIILHCSATRPAWLAEHSVEAKADEIRLWHTRDNGWADIGYHFVVDRDGAIAEGRPVETPGAHVKGRNRDSIGVCLIGGHGSNETDDPGRHFTDAQLDEARALIERLQNDYPGATIHGHNEFAAKACPGFNVAAWWAEKRRKSPAQSKTVAASAGQIVTAAGGVFGALSQLDGTVQIVVVVGCLVLAGLAGFILRERLRAWAAGWR